jgi:hypothetical protein
MNSQANNETPDINAKKPFWQEITRMETWISVILITLAGLLAYAPLINRFGFYWEDWYVIWAGFNQGPEFFIPLFARERPMVGYLYRLVYPLLGNNPLPWQIYAFLVRLAGALALFWLLRMVWQREKYATTIASLLFLVYPGFLQQPQATTFQFHLVPLALAILSIALTIYATHAKNLVLTILALLIAVISAALYIMIIEYYIGLEAIRIILMWVVLRRKEKQSWAKEFRRFIYYLSPFVLSAVIFLMWRLFVFESSRAATNVNRLLAGYLTSGLYTFYRIGVEFARDILETVVLAWTVPYEKYLYWGSYQDLLLGVFLALVIVVLVIGYYILIKRMDPLDEGSYPDKAVYKAMIWIGALAFSFGLLPAILANRGVKFDFFNRLDRYTLPGSIGAVLFVCGIVFSALRPRYSSGVLALLVGFAVLAHYNYSLYMRDFWQLERQVWWQLSWRAPQIRSATILFLYISPPFGIDGEAEVWAPANLIYYHQAGNPPITADVLTRETVFQVFQGIKKPRTYRNIWLNRNYANTLVMSITQIGSCLNVIDGAKYELPTEEDPLVRLVAPYSKISRIQTGGYFKQPSSLIFGAEPEHTWCYYYEKAMYARQVGDWAGIARLGDEARARGYSAGDASEWMVFLEGYASVGRDKEAKQLAASIRSDENMQYSVCQQLSTPPDYPQGYAYAKVYELLCSLSPS